VCTSVGKGVADIGGMGVKGVTDIGGMGVKGVTDVGKGVTGAVGSLFHKKKKSKTDVKEGEITDLHKDLDADEEKHEDKGMLKNSMGTIGGVFGKKHKHDKHKDEKHESKEDKEGTVLKAIQMGCTGQKWYLPALPRYFHFGQHSMCGYFNCWCGEHHPWRKNGWDYEAVCPTGTGVVELQVKQNRHGDEKALTDLEVTCG